MHDPCDLPFSVPRSLRRSSLARRSLAGALALLPALGCVMGEGSLGDYTESDTGTGTGGDPSGADGSSTGPGCTEDCDPDFAVAFIRAINSGARNVYLMGDTTCDGPSCPAMLSPVDVGGVPVEPCPVSGYALESPLGVEEYCRLAPLWLAQGLDVGFTTPVDRSSFEVLRTSPDTGMPEPYLWHTGVVALHGPGTAVRGRYEHGGTGEPDRLTAFFNVTCAERLTAQGIDWTPEQLETLCVGTWDDGGVTRPLRLAPDMVLEPVAGQLSTRGLSCDTPGSGPDTCCSACDRMLGPAVARYGVDATGERRSPQEGTAIACDPLGDPLVECRDLVLAVEREPGPSYTYAWDGAPQAWPLPRYDKLRETHPGDRPAGLEAAGAPCINDGGCDDGQACVGTNPSGDACSTGEDCTNRTCRAEWFGDCRSTQAGAACVDRRFDQNGAGACMVANAEFAGGSAGDRLSQCDANEDTLLESAECCDPALGGAAGCDPFMQPGVAPVPRHDRYPSLGDVGACACEEGQPDACADVIDAWCEAPVGSGSDPGPDSPAGDYAVPLLTRLGGVRWDEERQMLDLRLAALGDLPRADTEACAEAHGEIGGRSPGDSWMANAEWLAERLADHDLALCSGSTYRLVFAGSDAEQHVRSAAAGTLDGRNEHVIETSQFRFEPWSLFPSDNLTIGACDQLEVRFSNRFDGSESNLRKLELREGTIDGPRVAGGLDCDPLADATAIAAGAIPCLTFDANEAFLGKLRFSLDAEIHGPVLQPGTRYHVVLPGLPNIADMAEPEAYAAAFHDVCGMPLVVGETPEELELSQMSFLVDEPCR